MKKIVGLALVSVLVAGGIAVFAGSGDCMSGKAAKSCSPMGTSLKLTDEQQARVATLMRDCAKATSTSERRATCEAGMEKILTPEQFTQWKAMHDQASKTGACPTMGGGASKKGCCSEPMSSPK